MSKRITPEEVIQFHKLYHKHGRYADVARLTGRSASTIAKYINMKGAPQIAVHTFKEVMHKV